MTTAPAFHADEISVQERLGVRDVAVRMERTVTRSAIPPNAAGFLEDQRLLAISWLGWEDTRRVTLVSGPPGFVTVESPRSVLVHTQDLPQELLDGQRSSFALGATAIDLPARRRAKLKGTATLTADGLRLRIDRVYALCPKYIQAREPRALASGRIERPCRDGFDQQMSEAIARADTAFVGTHHPATGADASHRGGHPGFLDVIDDRTLVWEDYVGNNMFNTIGNIQYDPRAALVVADFLNGRLIEVSGEVEVEWEPRRRLVLTVRAVRNVDGAIPLAWTAPIPSPHNPRP